MKRLPYWKIGNSAHSTHPFSVQCYPWCWGPVCETRAGAVFAWLRYIWPIRPIYDTIQNIRHVRRFRRVHCEWCNGCGIDLADDCERCAGKGYNIRATKACVASDKLKFPKCYSRYWIFRSRS